MDNNSQELWNYLWAHIEIEKELYSKTKIEMEEENNGTSN